LHNQYTTIQQVNS